MEKPDRRLHWENIYETKSLNEVSWYQPRPETSLDLIEEMNTPLSAGIIDIGGGDSLLVDHLLEKGYHNITVLDISEKAIEKAKKRLGPKADMVKWITTDVTTFQPTEKYDLWHDRAAFHFLTAPEDISTYVNTAKNSITPGGTLLIGTFSEKGPKKCSGIDIRQYSESSMNGLFKDGFVRIKCQTTDHRTPFDTVQNFIFCVFRKI